MTTVLANELSQLDASEQMIFTMRYEADKKASTTAVLLAVLLGTLGAHQFYMQRFWIGVLYLLFFWAFYITALIALVEAFFMKRRVARFNDKLALGIIQQIKAGAAGENKQT